MSDDLATVMPAPARPPATRGPSSEAPLSRAIERRLRESISRTPPHPGRFLETRYLKPAGITQGELATALRISRRRVNELIRGRRAITPDTAVRLAIYFGNDAMFWMQLQAAWELNEAVRRLKAR